MDRNLSFSQKYRGRPPLPTAVALTLGVIYHFPIRSYLKKPIYYGTAPRSRNNLLYDYKNLKRDLDIP
jgi:hypothetical protein